MELFEEYEKIFIKNMYTSSNEYIDKINKPYKISGNIFSHVLRRNIIEILENKYNVSVVNSYIKGCNIEWDLLILKNPSKEEIEYNIYSPENVICALEFKTSGAIYSVNPIESKNYIKKYIKELEKINNIHNTNIQYGYISLCEIPKNYEAMDEEFHHHCFWMIKGYYGSRNKLGIQTKDDLKEFIESIIN